MPTKEEAYKQLLNSTREQIQAQHDARNLVQLVQQLLERVDKLESEVRSIQDAVKHIEQHSIKQHGLEAFHNTWD